VLRLVDYERRLDSNEIDGSDRQAGSGTARMTIAYDAYDLLQRLVEAHTVKKIRLAYVLCGIGVVARGAVSSHTRTLNRGALARQQDRNTVMLRDMTTANRIARDIFGDELTIPAVE
jgi:hypothetical protein